MAAVRLHHIIAAVELSLTEGGLGAGGRERHAANRPLPTTGSRLHNYLIMTMGPGAIRQGRGVEKPKETEQMEIVARGRSSWRSLQGDGATGGVARPDRVDICRRGISRATAKC